MENDNLKRIAKFFDGEMNPEELRLFDTDCKSDSDLANDLMLHEETNNFILDYTKKKDFRNVVEEVHKQYILKFEKTENKLLLNEKTSRKRKISNYVYWSVAEVIITIFVFTAVLKFFNGKKSNDQLFAEYYIPKEPIALRSSDSVQNNSASQCMSAYSKKDYKKAVQCFEKQMSLDKTNNINIFYSAISYIELQNTAQAISYFNILIKSNDFSFQESSLWYSGLCYLKNNQKDSAMFCFRKLNNDTEFYKEKAAKIIKELN